MTNKIILDLLSLSKNKKEIRVLTLIPFYFFYNLNDYIKGDIKYNRWKTNKKYIPIIPIITFLIKTIIANPNNNA